MMIPLTESEMAAAYQDIVKLITVRTIRLRELALIDQKLAVLTNQVAAETVPEILKAPEQDA